MLCLSPLTVLPCSPLEQIDAAHAAGFDAVDLRLLPVLPTDTDVLADAALLRAIERRLAATGLRVLGIELVRVGPDSDVAALDPVLRCAADLGASTLLVTSQAAAEYQASEERQTARKLGALCELAGRFGLRPMLEFMVFRGIARLEDAVRVARLADHPNVGICVDALHLQRSGGSPASLAAVDPAWLACLQLCDAPAAQPADLAAEARYDRLYPGEGGLPLRALLQAVPADLPISLEAPCRARAGRPVAERASEIARCARSLIASVRGAQRSKE